MALENFPTDPINYKTAYLLSSRLLHPFDPWVYPLVFECSADVHPLGGTGI